MYRVRDLDAGRAFYSGTLGFAVIELDDEKRYAELELGEMRIALVEGEPASEEESGVAMVVVDDVRSEAERLRDAGVEVGTVFELHGEVRLLDVFDPDGNRLQLTEDLPG